MAKEKRTYIGEVHVYEPRIAHIERGKIGKISLAAGWYKVIREFDEDRLLIEDGPDVTLIKKSLTNWQT